jgi:hypothetical protein
MQLTATLEEHWRDHARLAEAVDTSEATLRGLQELVERKRKIAEVLRQTKVGLTLHTGIRYLDLLYGAAVAQNRDLAQGMREMQREVKILEAEKAQFLLELSEVKK